MSRQPTWEEYEVVFKREMDEYLERCRDLGADL